MQPFTNYKFTELIHHICTSSYAFIEDKKTYNFTSSSIYYARSLFERNLIWLKRCIELHEFYKHETGLAIIRGLINTIKYFMKE